ncbi:hypothetical protein K474DRAFT_1641717 [Panus rudis PR-1116 ss-1]|nr:hypothetical protein K474DRAFT_1641717 [Panus rudis PR-1116 ss-1]
MSEVDVFQDEVPAIVDCDVLEAAKENIQPIAKGRRVTALSAILSTPHAQRESRLAAARNRFRINVEVALEDEDDDPLEAYCRFVDWTVENYPQGHSAESGLLELLEEATRVLRDDRGGKWKDDIRYLKLWVLYASYVEKPAIIYKFCLVNEIGTSHALLYEEFAIALERAGRRAQADETYLLGIARRAAPVERLEAKHREFQKRMLSAATLPPLEPPTQTSSSSSSGTKKRTVLGETSRSKSSRTASSSSRPLSQEDVMPPPPRPNGRMDVFIDPAGSADQDASAAPWPELGTRKSRVKENIREVSKAGGTTLKQAGRSTRSASAAAASKLTIFRDPEGTKDPASAEADEDDMPPPPAPSSSSSGKRGSKDVGKAKMAVFRDEESPPAKDTGKAKLTIFRDDEPAPVKQAGKSKLPIFRDDEPVPAKDTGKAKIPIFRDEDPAPRKDTGKAKMSIFQDPAPSETAVPSTPKFVPYRDGDTVPTTPSTTHSIVPGTVMKEKAVASKGVKMSSEAEALRKDPLKNYDEEERLAATMD